MGLDDTIAEREKKKMEQITDQQHKERLEQQNEAKGVRKIQSSLNSDRIKLKNLESSFWKFARKYSNIIDAPLSIASGPNRFLGLIKLSAVKTKDYDGKLCYLNLSALFDYKQNSTLKNFVKLSVQNDILKFEAKLWMRDDARYADASIRNQCKSYKEYKKHWAHLRIADFQQKKVIGWLDEQFVVYHKKQNTD